MSFIFEQFCTLLFFSFPSGKRTFIVKTNRKRFLYVMKRLAEYQILFAFSRQSSVLCWVCLVGKQHVKIFRSTNPCIVFIRTTAIRLLCVLLLGGNIHRPEQHDVFIEHHTMSASCHCLLYTPVVFLELTEADFLLLLVYCGGSF